jgi:hypothetical protein
MKVSEGSATRFSSSRANHVHSKGGITVDVDQPKSEILSITHNIHRDEDVELFEAGFSDTDSWLEYSSPCGQVPSTLNQYSVLVL